MLFDEEFIQKVEDDPVSGIVDATKYAEEQRKQLETGTNSWNEHEHEILWEASSFVDAAIRAHNLDVQITLPEPTGSISENCSNLAKYLREIREAFEETALRLKIETYTNRYAAAFRASFSYEFSTGDYERIQVLINELREQLASTDNLEDEHRQRLLKRLEKLQSELHKRVSDLDRFWGLVGDAGVVMGKLGNDAKPIVDRMREVAEIVWRTQARTEELPSSSSNPMLENEDSSA